MIKYSNARSDQVLENDIVEYRRSILFWQWRKGKVSYVPGITKLNKQMEHNGLAWVGITGFDGTFRGVFVDPSTKVLKSTVRLLSRSDQKAVFAPEDMDENDW